MPKQSGKTQVLLTLAPLPASTQCPLPPQSPKAAAVGAAFLKSLLPNATSSLVFLCKFSTATAGRLADSAVYLRDILLLLIEHPDSADARQCSLCLRRRRTRPYGPSTRHKLLSVLCVGHPPSLHRKFLSARPERDSCPRRMCTLKQACKPAKSGQGVG